MYRRLQCFINKPKSTKIQEKNVCITKINIYLQKLHNICLPIFNDPPPHNIKRKRYIISFKSCNHVLVC